MTDFTYNTDAGNTVTFDNSDIYYSAIDWYNTTPKSEIIDYCKKNNVNIFESNNKTLVDDWSDIAMELWAKNQ